MSGLGPKILNAQAGRINNCSGGEEQTDKSENETKEGKIRGSKR